MLTLDQKWFRNVIIPCETNPAQYCWTGLDVRTQGIYGKKEADDLAKKGFFKPFIGSEPGLGLSYGYVQKASPEMDCEETHGVMEIKSSTQVFKTAHWWN